MNPLQFKIKEVVDEYIQKFPVEYEAFCNSVADHRDLQANEYASLENKDTMLQQFVFEIPLTLDSMIRLRLDDEEKIYWDSKAGAEWFGRTFPHFSSALKI